MISVDEVERVVHTYELASRRGDINVRRRGIIILSILPRRPADVAVSFPR